MNRPAPLVAGAALIATACLVAVVSLWWTPFDLTAVDTAGSLLPPLTDGHLMGTDRLGRDVTSQIMAGARNSLIVGGAATGIAVVVGVALGLLVAASGRVAREIVTRVVDIGVAIPALLVALVLATVLGPGRTTVIAAIVISFVPWAARVSVGPARQILAREYVEAAFAYGRSRRYVMLRHVLPNIGSLIAVQAAIMFATAVLAEAALSFLGVGEPPPAQSWGRLLSESQSVAHQAPTLVIFPGLAITAVVLGFMLLGNGVHALLDPHQRRRVTEVAP